MPSHVNMSAFKAISRSLRYAEYQVILSTVRAMEGRIASKSQDHTRKIRGLIILPKFEICANLS